MNKMIQSLRRLTAVSVLGLVAACGIGRAAERPVDTAADRDLRFL